MRYEILDTPAARARCEKQLELRGYPATLFVGLIDDIRHQLNGQAEFAKSVTSPGVLRDNGERNEKEFSFNQWSSDAKDIDEFLKTVMASKGFQVGVKVVPVKIKIEAQMAG